MARVVDEKLSEEDVKQITFPRIVKIGSGMVASARGGAEPGYALIFQQDTDAPLAGFAIDSDAAAQVAGALALAALRMNDSKVLASIVAVGLLVAEHVAASKGSGSDNT